MVYPRQSIGGSASKGAISRGNRSIFDRPELRGSLNRRSTSPAEERIIRVDSRKKIASSSAGSANSSSSGKAEAFTLKDRLRKISVESLVQKPTTDRRSNSSTRDGTMLGKERIGHCKS